MACQYDKRIVELTRNLLHLYRKHTNDADVALGTVWYPKAHAIMCEWADTYRVSIATAACVTAAISPQCSWERNLVIADDVLAERAISVGGALHTNVRKARAIRADRASATLGYFKSAPKVACFSRNLSGDYSLVTVDTHGVQAALADVEATVTLKWNPYQAFGSAYIHAAERLKLEPAIFQAIVWHTWKRLYPWGKKQKLRQQWHAVGEC